MTEIANNPGIHLIGSYYAPDLETGLSQVVDTVGDKLYFGMPDLELDMNGAERKDWVIGALRNLRDHTPGIIVKKPGNYTSYEDMALLDIGPEGLDPFDIKLGYFDAAKQSLPFVRQALAAAGREDLPMEIGIPGYGQLPPFAFGRVKGMLPKYRRPLMQATQHEQVRIAHDHELAADGGVGVQTEHPVETLMMLEAWQKSKRAGQALGNILGRSIAGQQADLPRTMPRAEHLCYGRFMGEPAAEPDLEQPGALQPVITLANEIAAHKPKHHDPTRVTTLPIVAESGHLPSERAQNEIIAQLSDLVLHKETRVSLGIITYNTPADQVARFMERAQNKSNLIFMPGAPCGLSSLRHHNDPDAAYKVLKLHADVHDMLTRG